MRWGFPPRSHQPPAHRHPTSSLAQFRRTVRCNFSERCFAVNSCRAINRLGRNTRRTRMARRGRTTTSSSAPGRPAAPWPIGSARTPTAACWCSRPAAGTAIRGSASRSAGAGSCSSRRHDWMYFAEPEATMDGRRGRMRARQGDRRLVLDQRHGLCARPSRRLRALGGRRARRLVLRACAALFPPPGKLGRRCRPLSRRRRAADGAAHRAMPTRWSRPTSLPAAPPGIRQPTDYNGAAAGGLRPLADDDPRRPAMQRRGRLSAPGAGAAQSRRRRPRRWRRAFCSTAVAPSASNT